MTEVRIQLPLPLDITGTLISVIGMTYPGTVIKDGKGRWQSENTLVLDIPDEERHKSAKKAKKYQAVKTHLDGNADTMIQELGPRGASIATPDWLTRILVEYAARWIDSEPEAKNYLEMTVHDKETGKSYEIIVAHSAEQTPHAIAKAAKTEVEQLKAQLAEVAG